MESSTYPASTVTLITVIHFAYSFSLFLSGARVNAKDNKWLTPLHRAVASCSEVRHVLHVVGTTNINKQMFSGSLMSSLCVQEAVQVLLKHSADVNARDKNWQTPLHVAAAHKAVRCAEALVPLLSNVNVSDRAGRTPLHHAAFSGHLEVRCSLSLSFLTHTDQQVHNICLSSQWKQDLFTQTMKQKAKPK